MNRFQTLPSISTCAATSGEMDLVDNWLCSLRMFGGAPAAL